MADDEEQDVDSAAARVARGLAAWIRKLGPYLIVEALLPGGTVLALLLFLYRRSRDAAPGANMPMTAGGPVKRLADSVASLPKRLAALQAGAIGPGARGAPAALGLSRVR
jgi:hypothetical protein